MSEKAKYRNSYSPRIRSMRETTKEFKEKKKHR